MDEAQTDVDAEDAAPITNAELAQLLEVLETANAAMTKAGEKITRLEVIEKWATAIIELIGAKEDKVEPIFVMKRDSELGPALNHAFVELDAALGDRPSRDFLISYERTIH